MNPDDPDIVAERLSHTIDLLRAEIARLRIEEMHHYELSSRRLASIEAAVSDHETRLRTVADGVVQFKVWSGLTSGGSSLLAITAFLRSIFGA